MTFYEWITSSFPNPKIDGHWGWLHITTLVVCVGVVVALYFIFRKKSDKAKRCVLFIFAGVLLLFEITRRVAYFVEVGDALDLNGVLHALLPRPMCAMMSFMVILAPFINKKGFYTVTSIGGLLATGVFFLYPGVGFNNQYILFTNLYSICTHSIIFTASITFIVFKLAQFRYKEIWKSVVFLACCVIWALIQAYVLKIEYDAMYFMPNGDIHEIIGLPYPIFLLLYVLFVFVYVNIYYLIYDRKNVGKFLSGLTRKKAKKPKAPTPDN